MTRMRFENTEIFNIQGALRGMRFPMKGIGDTIGNAIGKDDMRVAMKLWNASEKDNLAHSKFLRQILVAVDISAPKYFWSEMDTYKIGTTANSESTMHKLRKDAFNLTLDDFQVDKEGEEHLLFCVIPYLKNVAENPNYDEIKRLRLLKQALPDSYIQKRHWTANYEILRNIHNQRYGHRLSEWHTDFVAWIDTLPYAEDFITKRRFPQF